LQLEMSYQIAFPAGFGNTRIATGRELLDKGLALTFPSRRSSVVIQIQPQRTQ